MVDINKLVIVYQIGKVGSTSIVKTLHDLVDVESRQCHFLGEKSYKNILNNILRPETSEYFFYHNSGQLIHNIKTEREINKWVASGKEVYFLTLARNPLDWFRSAIIQDLPGTFALMDSFARKNHKSEDVYRFFLNTILNEILEIINLLDDSEKYLKKMPAKMINHLSGINNKYNEYSSFVVQTINIFFRPFFWFEQHYREFTGLNVEIDSEGKYFHIDGKKHYLVVRYEDFNTIIHYLNEKFNIPVNELKKENLSKNKTGSLEVKIIIDEWKTNNEIASFLNSTSYCNKFNYIY